MRKVISLYLPTWPTDRLRRRLGASAPPPDTPLVMIGRDARRRIVTAADAAAQAVGLRVGMAATQAHALIPDLVAHDADPEGDAAGLDRLALWALKRYTPVIAATPPDGLMIEATGADHLHGGDEAMLRDLVRRLSEAGTAARVAMAPTFGAAHAFARLLPKPLVLVGDADLEQVLQALPISALRLPPATVDGLRRLGFDRVGELNATPRPPLALRFGADVGRRLDQAYGRLPEPIEPVDAPELPFVERRFAEPIAAPETIARYIEKLVVLLLEQLESDGLGARRLDLRFYRVDNLVEAIRAGTAKPTRQHKQLVRLLTDRISTIDPGYGIERMTLSAPLTEPLRYHNGSTLEDCTKPDIAELVDLLANRCGEERLFRLAAKESDVPERSVKRIEPMAAATELRWPLHWPRPSRMLKRPERIETIALLPDHPPVQFSWRRTRHKVARADGPERIYGEWANSDAELLGVRDYFLVEDDAGIRYWVFRQGDGEDGATGGQEWYMHGLFG
ncbi:DNA polymerase Y family protein [Sphingobium sufflavum]|uniref:Y-family DNA polymerase n=1 Tax=Sphingobium sufflavum TaxID=1129547 RepID=UPI001F3C1E10|nr:DNA polymerase Y family protein [Sphingobium sufflavum]MCE7798711.1 DNA polymerase Y family protein [Sphingobium sufflavum]